MNMIDFFDGMPVYIPPAVLGWSRKRRQKWIRRARKRNDILNRVAGEVVSKVLAERSPFWNLLLSNSGFIPGGLF